MTHDELEKQLSSLGPIVREHLAAGFKEFIPPHRIIAHLKYGEALTDAERELLNRESRTVDQEVVQHNLAIFAKWQKVFASAASEAISPAGLNSALAERTLDVTPPVPSTLPTSGPEDSAKRFIAAFRDLVQVKRAGKTLASQLRVAIAWIARSIAFDERQSRDLLKAMEEAIGLENRSMAFRSSAENAVPSAWSCDQETVVALWNESASLRLAFGSDSEGKQLAIIGLQTDHDDREVTVAFTHRFNGRVADRFVIRTNGPPVVLPLNSGQHEYIVDVTTAGGKTMQHSIKKTV